MSANPFLRMALGTLDPGERFSDPPRFLTMAEQVDRGMVIHHNGCYVEAKPSYFVPPPDHRPCEIVDDPGGVTAYCRCGWLHWEPR